MPAWSGQAYRKDPAIDGIDRTAGVGLAECVASGARLPQTRPAIRFSFGAA